MERHREKGGIVIAATHAELGLKNVRTLTLGAPA
jgi:ABC-type transport system involved in cytochrome c biogenesis ATPase subunit